MSVRAPEAAALQGRRAAPTFLDRPAGAFRSLAFRLERMPTVPVLIAILVVGAILRFWALGAVGFNSDEAVYAGQAASILGDPAYTGQFPVFRAHPLLFQTVLSLAFLPGVSDVVARMVSVLFGLATLLAVHGLGRVLYGRGVGLVAALLMALMPYHVIVTRQVLLDGPETLFVVLSAYAVARFVVERSPRWLPVAAAFAGLAVVTKETALVVVAGLLIFLAISREVRIRFWQWALATLVFAVTVVVHPLTLSFSGRTSVGGSYVVWQFFRRANHGPAFYLQTVPWAIGPVVVVLAVAGFWFLRGERGWRERLLLCWIAAPVVFFEIWPVKGYQYLVVLAPAVALLAARTVLGCPLPRRWGGTEAGRPRMIRAAAVTLVALTLLVPAWQAVNPQPTGRFLAGSGGVPGGREAGRWIETEVPFGARFMTIGPSMANLVQFYGHRPAVALAVSPNPATRNPVYEAIDNPDRRLRSGDVQYVVWDAYSAERTPYFSERVMNYVHKYRGVAVHTETVARQGPDGTVVNQPAVTVFEVNP